MPYNPQKTYVSSHLRVFDPDRAETISVRLPGGVSYAAGQVLEETNVAAATEVQTATVTGVPTGGTFVLGWPSLSGGYDVTVPIAFNAAAATVQTAVDAVLGAGNTVVTGSVGGPYTITYAQEFLLQDIAVPVLVTNSLTGGTTPTVALATTTPGSSGAIGAYQAYSTGRASCVLARATRTDLAGRIVDEFGSGTALTVPAYSRCTVLGSDLVGVDATAIPSTGLPGTLGRLKQGASAAAAGSIVQVG